MRKIRGAPATGAPWVEPAATADPVDAEDPVDPVDVADVADVAEVAEVADAADADDVADAANAADMGLRQPLAAKPINSGSVAHFID
jgi:hypothetical protein